MDAEMGEIQESGEFVDLLMEKLGNLPKCRTALK